MAFAQVRPSPWRQAVDLANMMLVLAVRTDAERVYQRALAYFTPDEIAEAFAAARGIASPTQLRTMMKQDGRDLAAANSARSRPKRGRSRCSERGVPVRVDPRGSLVARRRCLVLTNIYAPAHPAYDCRSTDEPACGTGKVMILMAQAVPEATSVPCVAALPAGWTLGGVRVQRGEAQFWLDSDQAGDACGRGRRCAGNVRARPRARPRCPATRPGMRRFERPDQLPPRLRSARTYVSEGGCVTYEFEFDGDTNASAICRARRCARVPAPRGRWSRRSTTARSEPVRRGRPPCPGAS